MSPLNLVAAITANNAKPPSAKRNPMKATSQLLPDKTPRYGGKIKFPAPKNIANSANPITITSLKLICFSPI